MPAPSTLLSLALAASAALCLPAAAQTEGGFGDKARSLANARPYLGLTVARSPYRVPCLPSAITCGDSAAVGQLYAGSMVGNFWGLEMGYLNMGQIARPGGSARAEGLNLSLVGRTPTWRSVGVFGKVGTTYGRTENTLAGSGGAPSGSDSGFGMSFGAGVSYDFTPRLSATFAWDSQDFRFAGGGRDPVRSTSLGLRYRY